jgi:hypothetical protein
MVHENETPLQTTERQNRSAVRASRVGRLSVIKKPDLPSDRSTMSLTQPPPPIADGVTVASALTGGFEERRHVMTIRESDDLPPGTTTAVVLEGFASLSASTASVSSSSSSASGVNAAAIFNAAAVAAHVNEGFPPTRARHLATLQENASGTTTPTTTTGHLAIKEFAPWVNWPVKENTSVPRVRRQSKWTAHWPVAVLRLTI